MAELFDDISRIAGSGIPRRQMLRLIAGVLAGSAIPALWATRASAFVACGTSFNFMTGSEALLYPCATSGLHHDLGVECCQKARDKGVEAAKLQCPSTCPYIVVTSWQCNPDAGTCGQNDDRLVCSGEGYYYCHCDASPGHSCCGAGTYCTTATQKCCGTFCGPIGQPCPNNPSYPR